MDRSQTVTLTVVCMVYDKDRVLVQDKITKDVRGVIFPGGHIEEKEPCTDAVVREIFEETGLTIYEPKLCGIKEWFYEEHKRYMVFLYKTDKFSGTLTSSSEGEVFWTTFEELKNLNLIWHMDSMVKVMNTDSITELVLSDDYKDVRFI